MSQKKQNLTHDKDKQKCACSSKAGATRATRHWPTLRFSLRPSDVYVSKRVKEHLPDILGKALALIWLDREFADVFARDPQGTLEARGSHSRKIWSLNFGNQDQIGHGL